MVLVMTGCVVPRIPGSSASAMTSDQTHASDLVNATRAQYGLRGLAIDWDARSKAQSWAQHLASIGYLKHSNLASGIGGTWVAIGENVGFGGSIQAVHNAYMNSPPHRANIVEGRWTGLGTGVAYAGGLTYTVLVFIER